MHSSIASAIQYLKNRNYKIPVEILRYQANPKATKQSGDYYSIRASLWDAVYNSVNDYLSSSDTVRVFQNDLKRAIVESYSSAADIAYVDGGGSLPIDEDTSAFVTSAMNEQLAYVESLFQRMRLLRKESDVNSMQEAFDRASGYANSLDAFYNNVKLAGAGNMMLTFTGDDGKESCTDCQKYKDQRHRASWWISHNAVPPNRDFVCGGYNCEHVLVDDNGEEFTI